MVDVNLKDLVVKSSTYYYDNELFTGRAIVNIRGKMLRILYLKDGKRHREGGPAEISYGRGCNEAWYINGRLHREGGPALVYSSGQKIWYRNGFWHREDGPAITRPNGRNEWYLNGEAYSINSWAKKIGIFETDDFVMMKLKYG